MSQSRVAFLFALALSWSAACDGGEPYGQCEPDVPPSCPAEEASAVGACPAVELSCRYCAAEDPAAGTVCKCESADGGDPEWRCSDFAY